MHLGRAALEEGSGRRVARRGAPYSRLNRPREGDEMERTTRKRMLAWLGGAGAALAGAQTARADHGPGHVEDIVGSWYATITAEEPPLGAFHGFFTFTRDGNITEARRLYVPVSPAGPLLETPGHGAWRRKGPGYDATFIFLLQQAPPSAGAEVGRDKVRARFEVDGNLLHGTFVSQIQDVTGTATIFVVAGVIEAQRILVEPLPASGP
jgi:hypothetical protein